MAYQYLSQKYFQYRQFYIPALPPISTIFTGLSLISIHYTFQIHLLKNRQQQSTESAAFQLKLFYLSKERLTTFASSIPNDHLKVGFSIRGRHKRYGRTKIRRGLHFFQHNHFSSYKTNLLRNNK